MSRRNENPGCIVGSLTVASGVFFVLLGLSGVGGCGGTQQLTDHAAVTAACIREEHRVLAEENTQEDARPRLETLREVCDSLLWVIEHNGGGQ